MSYKILPTPLRVRKKITYFTSYNTYGYEISGDYGRNIWNGQSRIYNIFLVLYEGLWPLPLEPLHWTASPSGQPFLMSFPHKPPIPVSVMVTHGSFSTWPPKPVCSRQTTEQEGARWDWLYPSLSNPQPRKCRGTRDIQQQGWNLLKDGQNSFETSSFYMFWCKICTISCEGFPVRHYHLNFPNDP